MPKRAREKNGGEDRKLHMTEVYKEIKGRGKRSRGVKTCREGRKWRGYQWERKNGG